MDIVLQEKELQSALDLVSFNPNDFDTRCLNTMIQEYLKNKDVNQKKEYY